MTENNYSKPICQLANILKNNDKDYTTEELSKELAEQTAKVMQVAMEYGSFELKNKDELTPQDKLDYVDNMIEGLGVYKKYLEMKSVTDTLLKMHIKGLFEEDISKIITFANNPDGYQLTLTKVATPVAEEQDSKIEEHNFESTVDPFAEDDYSEKPDEDNDKLLFN